MDDATDDRPSAGRFAGTEHRLPLRVYYEDTDAGGVVYHANYLRFMERGRSNMLTLLGTDQRAARDAGVGQYVVAEVQLRFLKPGMLHDELVVVSQLVKLGGASSVIQQRVMRGADVLAQADVVVVFTSLDGRPKRQPAEWVETFQRMKGNRWS
ncbi:YbgC/FadM family acyl-CoA thioesterase [Sphingomonas naphthae]|uniref:YbgC/FadM family acyl-CoA thioesterase n=1 Tax=Sphingomonas naphthae TaxID=1813468 RepID=A0ABY7THF0_9SPHN|nr:YbgC/FadM family acyl-CoA thioesterase [Sphingomonas naphthae]WCT72478.1 YbgC/FadM family acyl-CoA thioesterase [Sphingomonas naphthae]